MTLIDTEALLSHIDLVDLVSQDVQLRGRGKTLHGPCPFCNAGVDRFTVKTETQRWACNQCTTTGRGCWSDAIGYVRKRHNLDFGRACEWLAQWAGLSEVPLVNVDQSTKTTKRTSLYEPDPPNQKWQAKGWRVVEHCESVVLAT